MWPAERKGRRHAVLIIGAGTLEAALLEGYGRDTQCVDHRSVPLSLGSGKAALATNDDLQTALNRLLMTWPEDGTTALSGLRVVVSEAWMPVSLMPWSSALQGDGAARHMAARAHLAQAGHDTGADDAVRLDDRPHGSPRLVAACPAMITEAIHAWARRVKPASLSMLPMSVAGWEGAVGGQAGLAGLLVLDGPILVAVRGRHGSLLSSAGVDDVAVLRASSPQEGPLLWRRLRLRETGWSHVARPMLVDAGAGLPAWQTPDFARPALPQVAGFPSSGSELLQGLILSRVPIHPLDVLGDEPRWTPRRLGFVAAALLMVAALSLHLAERFVALRAMEDRLEGSLPRMSRVEPRPEWTRQELANVHAVNAAVRTLNLPITALLRALRPPKDIQVAILGIDSAAGPALSSGSGLSSVLILAEAPSSADMARYVAFVARQHPFQRAYLSKHEVETAGGARSYRFTLEAQWNSE